MQSRTAASRPKRLLRQPGGFERAASSDRLLDLALGGGVLAFAALAEVRAAAALELVLALLAEQAVLALPALERVLAGAAKGRAGLVRVRRAPGTRTLWGLLRVAVGSAGCADT
jgi:hypothetical protein